MYYRYKRYGEHRYLHILADIILLTLVLSTEVIILLIYPRELESFFYKFENVLWIIFLVCFIIMCFIISFIHDALEKIIIKAEKKKYTYKSKNPSNKIHYTNNLYHQARNQVYGNICICPKIQEQLYNLKENDYLKLNRKQLKVIKSYDKTNDTIKVLESKKTKDGYIITSEVSLNAEEVFKQLGITAEMTSLEFYIDKLKSFANDKQVILPEKTINNVNELFKCYYPFLEDNLKLNTFIDNINRNNLILNKIEIIDIFEYFDNKVNPFVYYVCMCYIAIHEYDSFIEKNNIISNIYEIYNICKIKLPWIKLNTLELYLFHIWKEKGLSRCN